MCHTTVAGIAVTTGSALLQLQTDPHRKEGECAFMLFPKKLAVTVDNGQIRSARKELHAYGLLISSPKSKCSDVCNIRSLTYEVKRKL